MTKAKENIIELLLKIGFVKCNDNHYTHKSDVIEYGFYLNDMDAIVQWCYYPLEQVFPEITVMSLSSVKDFINKNKNVHKKSL